MNQINKLFWIYNTYLMNKQGEIVYGKNLLYNIHYF